jgi:hypothetical protein
METLDRATALEKAAQDLKWERLRTQSILT